MESNSQTIVKAQELHKKKPAVSDAFMSEQDAAQPMVCQPDKKLIDYVMTAIIEFAHRHNLSIRDASNYLNQFKGIDFLSEFYDVEHTLSFNDCVDDLTVICQNNGGMLE